jgi:hypothetical protein
MFYLAKSHRRSNLEGFTMYLVRYRYYVIRLSPIQLITEIVPSYLYFV